MGKNNLNIPKILSEIEDEAEFNSEPDVKDIYDYEEPGEIRLMLVLWSFFRLLRILKVPLKSQDYYDIEHSAIEHLWRQHGKID